MNSTEERNRMGEAYMFCNDCGAKLYSFDGNRDASMNCPYMDYTYGECKTPEERLHG